MHGVYNLRKTKNLHNETVKELYHEMKQRIRIIINLLGPLEPNKQNNLPEEKTFDKIANLINSIMSSAQFESENQYREAIVNISDWLNEAFNKEYLTENAAIYPNPLFTVKRGAEILHSLFHRDLRRKLLSSEEHELVRSFNALIQQLPDPRKSKLEQDDVDNMIDELLKSS